MIKIQRALISVSDKTGLVEIGKFLEKHGVEILSTGGTLSELSKNGVNVTSVDSYTGFPEILGGRVKTLHPKIHGGLLGDPDNKEHERELLSHKIPSIDLIIVNLYPFASTIQKPNVTIEEAIENIDIGGPSMLRSGAKNYKHTVVITDLSDYEVLKKEMDENSGSVKKTTSFELAVKAFRNTASYDSVISNHLTSLLKIKYPEKITLSFRKKQDLRYGENPHQTAAFYEPLLAKSDFSPIQGKELSFNNMLDFDAAFHIASLLPKNTVSIIKHLNPCGIGSGETTLESFELAKRTDPISMFGGIIGVSGVVDDVLASKITEVFVEGVIAEKFTEEAKSVFSKKPNIRLIQIEKFKEALLEIDLRPIHHGILIQDRDYYTIQEKDFRVVTKLKPDEEDIKGLWFAWNCVRFIKSNAIVYTDTNSTIGIGAGQMSRVDSVELGALKAQKVGLSVVGTYVGSDAFFPFRDGIDAIAKVGAKAIIQPGGSIRDEEVIEAADKHGLIMVFTGMRHFRH
ncbi:MAG: bifunctional phosphoribosylaminoimidazolecarboxamide formyltransferase/IMP cyclohydrolase [Leptospiraceae bacterium]|nr:bifunctional phosphoribosylaminoimidazolecarboxamide formyltransferase/IMP cyclohydrolase [Leptospiraceae bacterium]MCK6380256.1 bifunctional phosphoribosylaminoimidazolecarboxamide formyltransferase/IMP cyclohydrolase [Leptospiraceae bacterium]NUM40900.1 bifunctional phosphoribosylaminoimidazolecarboxamide formyltransferase/IMP cyclohydrolase [Leptospiraceae bacterium]